MRGTCSAGFKLVASGGKRADPAGGYDEIHARTMMPVAHLLWSSAWAGIAAAAVERARAFVRKAAQRADGTLPPGAAHLTRANASLQTLRSLIAGALQRFELAADDPVALESLDFQTAMNLLKVNASELAVATVMSAMQACGLAGYRNDGEFSIGRHLRDILSSPIMISNDRILANLGTASLLSGAPASLARLNRGRRVITAESEAKSMNVAFKEPQTSDPFARCHRRGAVAAVGHRRRLRAHRRLRGRRRRAYGV